MNAKPDELFSPVTAKVLSKANAKPRGHIEIGPMRFTESDKQWHGYIPAYSRVAGIVGKSANVCELGVHGGGSLDLWKNVFFREGIIAGVDNSESAFWPEGTIRIVCDQTDPDLPDKLLAITNTWDLIIDDCSHQDIFTLHSWELLWDIVRPGGFYIIEDWIDTEMRHTANAFIDDIMASHTEIESVEYWRGAKRADGLIIIRKRG